MRVVPAWMFPENWAAHLVPWAKVANSLKQCPPSQRTPSVAFVPSGKVHSMEIESKPWPRFVLLAARPPMPCAVTGQSSLSQQISSIWWMFISANSPPETQKNRVKLRICHSSSSYPSGFGAHAADRDACGRPG